MSDAGLNEPGVGRVKSIAALAKASMRSRTGRFLIEGPSAVIEALSQTQPITVSVPEVYITQETLDASERLNELIHEGSSRAFLVSEKTMDQMSDAVTPQGVLAIGEIPESGVFPPPDSDLVVVLAHVRDPGNAGTAIRVADAVDADAIHLSHGSVDPYSPKVVRSTTGSLFHLPVTRGEEIPSIVHTLRNAGFTVLAADGSGQITLDEVMDAKTPIDLCGKTAWVFGNESWGMSPEELAACDAVIRIPIAGRAESLNLATASAVCLYATAWARRGLPRSDQ